MDRERIIQVFFFGFLAVIAYQLYQLLHPFLVPILWAILLSFIFHPLYLLTNRLIRQRSLAALAITLLVALGVIVPALWLSTLLAAEAQALYAKVSAMVADGSFGRLRDQAFHSKMVATLSDMLDRHGVKLEEELTGLAISAAKLTSDALVSNVTGVARNLAFFFIDFGVMLLTFFYLLRDGEGYFEALRNLTPLHEDDKGAVFDSLRNSLSAVMRGLLLTALAQGFMVGAAFAVLGVPYWAFLSIVSAACGLLPFGGTGLVWVPASAYLLYAYGWGRALALLIWGSLAVGTIDNFIKPYAMGHGIGLPTLVLFFGIAGGLEVYGVLGLFLGPAVIAVFAALLRVYRKTYGATQREAA